MQDSPGNRSRRAIVHRRNLLAGAAVTGTASLLGHHSATSAQALEKPAVSEFETALKKIMGDAKPGDGKLVLEIPEIAENGNTVPYILTVESPMTENDFVKTLHVLSAGNPQPGIASFTLTPASGRAFAAGRMRLARTQEVAAVAELSDGRFLLARRTVKVTIGGCGG